MNCPLSTINYPLNNAGQRERITQNSVVKLFCEQLGYDYLGDWQHREGNRNIEETYLRDFLKRRQGYGDAIIARAMYELNKSAGDQSKHLYDVNREVYTLLRYGIQVKADAGENKQTFWLIDWKNPGNNHFALAEEVTCRGEQPFAHTKRPDLVIYVNGIALGMLELKRSTQSVSQGIRQNLDNQKKLFIRPFFTTVQLVMAGNDTEGLRYAPIETSEKYFLTWKEDSPMGAIHETPLHRHLLQLCEKSRFLELIHDFMVFDAGQKKTCRHNQFFGVKAARESIRRREGGIIWHTQGSGKSLTMVWLAKWLRENVPDARVLIITDRTELDEQIEKVFTGVNEQIYRTTSCADLIASLNSATPWLLCSLIHKFAGREESDIDGFISEIQRLPSGFRAKGDLYVFVDECHRTQSGDLHKAMKAILPSALFIGFTGTPLLKADKQKSIEIFGKYIHTYRFDEAVQDKVVLDLRYEARDIDQKLTSTAKIDQWFEAKTSGLNDYAKAQLKKRWGTMQRVLSSQSRLEKIVADILMDMATKDRLMSGKGNALLVSGSIYQACKFYELFTSHGFDNCAIITSYIPSVASIKGEESGEGATEKLRQYDIYRKMLGNWFNEAPDRAVNRIEEFDKQVKKKFIDEPGQMKLLIVVDKLLTGFDAPSATYLYIDKQMQDHGLFQAICRINRLNGDDKEYGYIIDYKDLFRSLEGAVHDYTAGAFDAYDKQDVAGLLSDRLEKGREQLEEAREAVKALFEAVEPPKGQREYLHYFCGTGDDVGARRAVPLQEHEPRRVALYKQVTALVRAYANLANELAEAGYTPRQIEQIKEEVAYYENVRAEVKLHSADYIDLKMYEPAMRHLIDTYIRAEESEKISAFDDMSLIQLIVERGPDALQKLPKGLRENKEAAAETIENNLRKVIIDEHPVNPKYYDQMSDLLDALIKQRREGALEYEKYLAEVVSLARKMTNPTTYPAALNSPGKRALYDNLDKDEEMAMAVDYAVLTIRKDSWRGQRFKEKEVRYAVKSVLKDEALTDRIFEIVKKQTHEY